MTRNICNKNEGFMISMSNCQCTCDCVCVGAGGFEHSFQRQIVRIKKNTVFTYCV